MVESIYFLKPAWCGDSSCRPLAGTGLPVRYCSHRLQAVVFTVRHAQSAANAGGRTVETATTPITDIGIRQAQCVADLVTERPALIAISRYQRTAQTAEPVLRRYVGVPVEQWRIEEFTYLDTTACDGTTYAERKGLRDACSKRCDPLWVDGPGCECFADLIGRVRRLQHRLNGRDRDQTVVVFTLMASSCARCFGSSSPQPTRSPATQWLTFTISSGAFRCQIALCSEVRQMGAASPAFAECVCGSHSGRSANRMTAVREAAMIPQHLRKAPFTAETSHFPRAGKPQDQSAEHY